MREVVALIEKAVGRKVIVELLAMQPGDVPATFADMEALELAEGFTPKTPIEIGVRSFVQWYHHYHRA